VAPGEEVVVLPSRRHSRIRSIEMFDGAAAEARTGDAVVVTLEDEIDVSRGDMIVRRKNIPTIGDRFEAYLCWMGEAPLELDRPYLLLHTTNRAQAFIERIEYRVDVDTLHRREADSLVLNEIGRVGITTSKPLFFDSYRVNVRTGSFVLVDLHSNVTVAAGMIRGEPTQDEEAGVGRDVALEGRPVSKDVTWQSWNIPREERERRNGHQAAILWFTGMSGAGKTTIAREVERRLFERGVRTMLLDGDQLRHGLSGDLGFTPGDRGENIRRVGEVAKLFFEQGSVVLCAFVSPYAKGRNAARALVPDGRFLEIHVHAPVEELRRRDPKGLYEREEKGEVAPLTGVSAPYEPPRSAELDLDTGLVGVQPAVEMVLQLLATMGIVE
jgi:bifunctional enzyme CysN/CysC